MADPLTIIGSASAIVQLIGGVSSGLRKLKDAVVAIKDAQKTVKRLEEKVHRLGQCLKVLEMYFKQRPSRIPFETQLYQLIQEIERSCTEPLEVLKTKTPTHLSKRKAAAAFDLWKNDTAITQAQSQIDDSIPYLNLLIETLQLFKADQNEDLLHQIAASLNQTAQHRTAVYEFNSHSFETTLKGIRTFAKDATGYVVQSVSKTTATSSRYISTSRPVDPNPVTSPVQVTAFPKSRRQLDHEWDQNRRDLKRLVGYRLFENAETIQRRALSIKEELSNDHGVPFSQKQRDEMEEQLADILIECKVEGSTEKAVALIEEIIGENPKARTTENANNLLTFPRSSTSGQKNLSLHYKLGVLYKETRQMDLAEKELRIAFNEYSEETPKNIPKIREIGEKLSELYEDRVGLGNTDHRSVLLSQQLAFKQELHTILGQPLEHRRTTCDKALEWCADKSIDVSNDDDVPRFDIVDERGSSPLHHAAEKCQDELALQQMTENSDTLENQDSNGDTPLLVAVSSSNTVALAVLLQKGANVKARDTQQQTPLHRSQKPSVTKFLLHDRLRRASTMTSGPFDESRRFSSSSSSTTLTTSPPTSITDQQDLDINAQDAHKKTALYLACSQGRDRIAKLLLLAGADPNIASHESTPLTITIESQARAYTRDPKKKVDIAAALVDRGADAEDGRRALLRGSSPRGMQKEILKALEGGRAPRPLQPSSSAEAGLARFDTRRDSGYQPSVSSTATKPQLEQPDLGPDWSAGFEDKQEG